MLHFRPKRELVYLKGNMNLTELENETQIPESVDQAAQNHEKKSPQESFAELKKAKEDLERELKQSKVERDWYEKQMQMQQQQQMQLRSTPEPEEEYDYRQLEQEEFPDGKKLVKAFNHFNKQLSQKDKAIAEANQKLIYLETTQQFPDFKEVVTAENIEKYIKSDEDYSEAVNSAANPLRKVYNLLKKDARFVADQAAKVAKDKPKSQEQVRVEEKESKPKLGSLGVRSEAVSTAAAVSNSKMTKEQKNALWAEMQQCSRR